MSPEAVSARSDSAPPGPMPDGSVEGLFATWETPLLRYAQQLVKDMETAQDIVQESFLRLHTEFHRVQQPRPWLYRTVHNLALNHLRSGRKIVRLEAGTASDQPDAAPGPAERMEHGERVAWARRCLELLDERERELVRLKFEEGLAYKEISARTGLSIGNVGYILHHALKRLAVAIQESGVKL